MTKKKRIIISVLVVVFLIVFTITGNYAVIYSITSVNNANYVYTYGMADDALIPAIWSAILA